MPHNPFASVSGNPEHINDLHAGSSESAADRDAKIESLLLSGLDHYFASDYAQAIDVWTRALFLDRNHARARAYIDRARSALAEQQRESEELLHNGIAAFERGEIEAARQLLNAAVHRGGAHDVALAFLTRIDRINAAAPADPTAAVAPRASAAPVPVPEERGTRQWTAVLLMAAALLTVALAVAARDELAAYIPIFRAGVEHNPVAVVPLQEPLKVPTSSEAAIERAQALFESGRLYDALRAVDLVRSTDPRRADADKLKADIQRALLAHAADAAAK